MDNERTDEWTNAAPLVPSSQPLLAANNTRLAHRTQNKYYFQKHYVRLCFTMTLFPLGTPCPRPALAATRARCATWRWTTVRGMRAPRPPAKMMAFVWTLSTTTPLTTRTLSTLSTLSILSTLSMPAALAHAQSTVLHRALSTHKATPLSVTVLGAGRATGTHTTHHTTHTSVVSPPC